MSTQLSAESILVARSLYRNLEDSLKGTLKVSLMGHADAYEGVYLSRQVIEQAWVDFCQKWGFAAFPPE